MKKTFQAVLLIIYSVQMSYSFTEVSGNIRNNSVWTTAGSPYIIDNATLKEDSSLTINAGVVIKFGSNENLNIYGIANIQGNSGSNVTFTSIKDDAIDGVDAGGDGATTPAIGDWSYVRCRSNITFNYCTFKYASNDRNGALYCDNSSPLIQNCTFIENLFPIEVSGSSFPRYSNNTFTNNKYTGIKLLGSTNTTDNVKDTLQKLSIPYLVIDPWANNIGYEIEQGDTVFVPAGTVFKISDDEDFYLNGGTLISLGTDIENVVFTSLKDDAVDGIDAEGDGATTPTIGDWSYVRCRSNITFNYCTFKYASNDRNGALYCDNSSPLIQNCTFIENLFPIEVSGSSFPRYSNNTFTNNKYTGIKLLGSTNTTDNVKDTLQKLSIPYLVIDPWANNIGYEIEQGDTVFVPAGTVFKISDDEDFYLNGGTLISLGTDIENVVFTSLKDDAVDGIDAEGDGATTPTIGDWSYVRCRSNITFNYCTFKYASNDRNGALYCDNSSPLIQNCTFIENLFPIEVSGSSFPRYSNNTFTDNQYTGIKLIGATNTTTNVTDTLQKLSIPYLIHDPGGSGLNYQIDEGDTVVIPAGTVIKISSDDNLFIYKGTLVSLGTDADNVVFTSLKDDAVDGIDAGGDGATTPAIGDWRNVECRSNISINYCTFKYGGSLNGALYCFNSSPLIQNNNFILNEAGIFIGSSSSPTIQNNNIISNYVIGINNSTTTNITATNNWWGNSSGPRHTGNPTGNGDSVSNYVTYSPWNTTPTNNGGDITPPQVSSTYPANNDFEIPLSDSIMVTFNEEMESSSIVNSSNLSVNGTVAGNITGSISYDNLQKKLTLVPSSNFPANDTITVVVKKDMVDKNGNELDGDKDGIAEGYDYDNYSFSFFSETTLPDTIIKITSFDLRDIQTSEHNYSEPCKGILFYITIQNTSSDLLTNINYKLSLDDFPDTLFILDSLHPDASKLITVKIDSLPRIFENKKVSFNIYEINGKTVNINHERTFSFYYIVNQNGIPFNIGSGGVGDAYHFLNSSFNWKSLREYWIAFSGTPKGIIPLYSITQQVGGRCFGMAATSGLYFQDPLLKPIDISTRAMDSTENIVMEEITKYHVSQALETFGTSDVDSVFNNITNDFKSNSPTILLCSNEITGHAVLGYKAIKNISDNKGVVYSYDSYTPDIILNLANFDFNLKKFSFSSIYDTIQSLKPHVVTSNLDVIEKFTNSLKTLITDLWNQGKILFSKACPVNMLITDSENNRIGYINDSTFVNEITSATHEEMDADSLGVEKVAIYYVPKDINYKIKYSSFSKGAMNIEIIKPLSPDSSLWIIFDSVNVDTHTVAFFNMDDTSNYSLEIDLDGDDIIDTVIFPDTGSTQNLAPEILTPVADLTVTEDTSDITYSDLNDVFNDDFEDGSLKFSILSNSNLALFSVSINSDSALVLSFTSNSNGSGEIIINAEDNWGVSTNDTFTVTVTAVNDAPILSSVTNQTTNEDTPIQLTMSMVTASDIEGDVLGLVVEPGANYTVNGTTVSPATNFNGALTVPVKVSDGTISSTAKNMTITVNPVNDAPEITTSIPDKTIKTDIEYTETFTATDVEDDPLTWFLVSPPAGMTIDESTGILTWTPIVTDTGTHPIKVVVKDASKEDTVSYNLTVDYESGINENTIPKENRKMHFFAVPNPVDKNGEVIQFYLLTPADVEAKLNIYDPVGNILFKNSCKINSNKYNNKPVKFTSWNLNNSYGVKVAPGTYLAVLRIESKDGNKEILKTMIGIKDY